MGETAVYPGTFDPITNGHLDIIKRACNLFKEVIVLIAEHREKSPAFTIEQRVKITREALKPYKNVKVSSYDELLVDYLKHNNLRIIIRGLRAVSDFDYEFQLTQLNRRLLPYVETIFIMPSEEYFFLSSSVIKEIALRKGNVSLFVPKASAVALKEKYG